MKSFKLSIIIGIIVLFPGIALAHSGGTDDKGGHYCWTDCKQFDLRVGEYHFHDVDENPIATYVNNDDVFDMVLAKRLHGQILLQVEEHGEAWYIRSKDSMRYYMKDGDVAYEMMRFFSLGIADADLVKIPSVANTTEMNSATSVCSTNTLANRLRGEILLQVEQHGEAWYIDPDTCRSIYMKDGVAAYEIMRFLGLGIANINLEKIPVGQIEM